MAGYINVASYTGTIGSLAVVNNLTVGGTFTYGTFYNNTGATGPTGTFPVASNFGDYIYWNGSSYASGDSVINLGTNAGQYNAGTTSVSLGYQAGMTGAGANSINIGTQAGLTGSGSNSISIGNQAGTYMASSGSINIGYQAGFLSNGVNSVSVGYDAGESNCGGYNVNVGSSAGQISAQALSVNIGLGAGQMYSATGCVNIGFRAGRNNPGVYSTSLGALAGGNISATNPMQSYAVAIGYQAFFNTGPTGSICINASGKSLDGASTGACYINPIRQLADESMNQAMYYNSSTSEVTVGSSSSAPNKMYYWITGGGTVIGSSSTPVAFGNAPTAADNVSGLTVSGSGNTTFANTSGFAQVWLISAGASTTNADVATYRFALQFFKNGISGGFSDSSYVPAGDASGFITFCIPIIMNNNDYFTINFLNTSTVNCTIGNSTLFITQM